MSDLEDFVKRGQAAQAAVDKLGAGKPQPVKGDWEIGDAAHGMSCPRCGGIPHYAGNALLITPRGDPSCDSVIAIIPDRPDAQQIAQLIVSAPKLLAALKDLTLEVLSDPDVHNSVKLISSYRKAVALLARLQRRASQ